MNWSLAASVAAVQLGDDIVFLDLDGDDYSCLRGQSEFSVVGRRVQARSIEAIRPLIEAGFLDARPAARDCNARLPPNRPVDDLDISPAATIELAELRDFLLCWIETLVRFPGRSVLALHKQVRDDGPSRPQPAFAQVRRRVAVFEALLPWVPFPGACLFRSYLLLRFLQRGGCDAGWIIGVRTWPFEAHCWLQIEQTALDDRCERLVRFQPLLSI